MLQTLREGYQKSQKFQPWWIEIVLMAIIAYVFYYAVKVYPQLPARFPIHFAANGLADDWTNKSISKVLMIPAVTAVVYTAMTLLSWALYGVKNPRMFINAPGGVLERMSDERVMIIHLFGLRMVFWIKVLMVTMLAYLGRASLDVAIGKISRISPLLMGYVILILLVTFGMGFRLMTLIYSKKYR